MPSMPLPASSNASVAAKTGAKSSLRMPSFQITKAFRSLTPPPESAVPYAPLPAREVDETLPSVPKSLQTPSVMTFLKAIRRMQQPREHDEDLPSRLRRGGSEALHSTQHVLHRAGRLASRPANAA